MNPQEKEKLYQSLIKNIVNNLSFNEEFNLTGTNLSPEIVVKTLENLNYYLVYYTVDEGEFECYFDYRDPTGTYDLSFIIYGMAFEFKMTKEEVE